MSQNKNNIFNAIDWQVFLKISFIFFILFTAINFLSNLNGIFNRQREYKRPIFSFRAIL